MNRSMKQWSERYLQGDLTRDEMLELAQRLDRDPRARKFFVQYITFDAAIGSALFGAKDATIPNAKARRRSRPATWVALGVAAAVAGVLALGWLMLSTVTPSPPARALATLNTTEDAVWAESHASDEGWLYPGAYRLVSGNASFTFDSGAMATVTGPADFQLNSPFEMALQSGDTGFYVGEAAHGFTVETPHARIVDRGTAFFVSVDGESGQQSEVQVIEGKVEVSTAELDDPVEYGAEKAVRVGADGELMDIAYTVNPRNAPRPPRRTLVNQYVHFSLDTPRVNASGIRHRGFAGIRQLRDDINTAFQSESKPTFSSGKFGNALHFDDVGLPTLTFSGVQDRSIYTVSVWVQFDSEADPERSTFVELRNNAGIEDRLSLSWNADERLGNLGALRVGYKSGYSIGTARINDGAWHHIAVTVVGGDNARVSTHLRHYVDGRLDVVTGLQDDTIAFGRSEGQQPKIAGFQFDSARPFRGAIDELLITGGRLGPEEIYRLYSSNREPY